MTKINATMGIKTLKYGTPNTASTAENPQMPTDTMKPVDVYQDTCTFVEKDPTVTEHKSETSSKKIIMSSKEGYDLAFSIMDPSDEELVAFKGGEVSADGGWEEPNYAPQIELAFEITPVEGKPLLISRAGVSAKINTTYSAKGITLLDVTVNPTERIKYGKAAS